MSKKKWWSLAAILLLLLVGIGGFLYWYFMNQPKPAPQASLPHSNAPVYSRLVVYSKNFSVTAFDPADSTVTDIYQATDAELKAFCNEGCSSRLISLSPDYSKIAFDSMLKDNKAAFGYYDRATKKVVVLANGEKPSWSPDGTRIAFVNDNGVNVMTLKTGAIATIDNTKPQFNADLGVALPPTIFGWKSNTELVFDSAHDPNHITFNIGDVSTKVNREVTIQGITVQESLREAVVSSDGTKMLIQIDKDPGYDVAVIDINGSGLARVTGNSAARWPGSGYDAAAFAPGGQTVLVSSGNTREGRKILKSLDDVFKT